MIKLYMLKNDADTLWMVSPNGYVEVSLDGTCWSESAFSANFLSKNNRSELVGTL